MIMFIIMNINGLCLDNMPENLQSSERYEKMEAAIDSLEAAIESIDSAKESIGEASA